MKKLFLALSLFISTPAYADWTEADTKREAVYMTLHVADWLQTREIARNPDKWSEANPILGDHPSVGRVNNYFAATALLHIAVAYALPPDWRKAFQYVTIAREVYAVGNNYHIGVKVVF